MVGPLTVRGMAPLKSLPKAVFLPQKYNFEHKLAESKEMFFFSVIRVGRIFFNDIIMYLVIGNTDLQDMLCFFYKDSGERLSYIIYCIL